MIAASVAVASFRVSDDRDARTPGLPAIKRGAHDGEASGQILVELDGVASRLALSDSVGDPPDIEGLQIRGESIVWTVAEQTHVRNMPEAHDLARLEDRPEEHERDLRHRSSNVDHQIDIDSLRELPRIPDDRSAR
jgi:hypothetical protein